jgi:hypothetical protein
VDLQYYMSSLDDTSYRFLTQFNAFYYILKQNLTFTPNYIVYENPGIQSDAKYDVDDCIGGGKYCAPDPDGDGVLTGRDSIMEDIR